MHVSSVKWCIERNIPVFVEKPVATNLKDLNLIKSSLIQKKVNQCCWISIKV